MLDPIQAHIHRFLDSHHSQGVWNLPHKCHLYLIEYILCELSLLINLKEGVEYNSLYEKLWNHLDKREKGAFGSTKPFMKSTPVKHALPFDGDLLGRSFFDWVRLQDRKSSPSVWQSEKKNQVTLFNKIFFLVTQGNRNYVRSVFRMAAIPILCNGLLINHFNFPRVNLWFILKSAKYTNFFLVFIFSI